MDIVIEDRRTTEQVAAARPALSAGPYRKVSWPALWAGAFAAMALQLVCGLLGVWAAPNSSSLLGGQFPLAGIPTGVAWWYLIFTIGAYYIGGQTATRAAGVSGVNGLLHGFLTWAFATMLGFFGLAIFAARNVVGLAGPIGNVVTATSTPGLALVSPAWMFWGLLLGLIVAIAGGYSAGAMLER